MLLVTHDPDSDDAHRKPVCGELASILCFDWNISSGCLWDTVFFVADAFIDRVLSTYIMLFIIMVLHCRGVACDRKNKPVPIWGFF